MLSGCTPRPQLNAKQMAAPKFSWSGSNYKGNPPWNDTVLRWKTPSVGQNTALTFRSANWKLTFGGAELFTADVLHGLAVRRKVWGVGGGGGGGSVVMKSDYSYDCGPLLSFLSPLQDWQQLTELPPLICSSTFHFHLCYLKPRLFFWTFTSQIPSFPSMVGIISTSSALQNKMPVIFFIEFWNPNINESKFSVFSPGLLLHSYK